MFNKIKPASYLIVSFLFIFVIFVVLSIFPQGNVLRGNANESAGLVIDGTEITAYPQPQIKEGRPLVPLRLVSENLGKEVKWDSKNRAVDITKEGLHVKLRIDNRLIEYENENVNYDLIEVPPQIIDNHTFVPPRLISNTFGAAVKWEEKDNTIYINSKREETIPPSFVVDMPTIEKGQIIAGKTDLKVNFEKNVPESAAEVRFLLLNPETGKGPVIARGEKIDATYKWLPHPRHEGSRILAAAVYDSSGDFLAGKVMPVNVELKPEVSIEGLEEEQEINHTLSLKSNFNFSAAYVKYEIINKDSGRETSSDKIDPQGSYDWRPWSKDNGEIIVRATAYDSTGNSYESSPVKASVDVEKNVELKGISEGSEVKEPVTLWLSRNFEIDKTKYILRNAGTGEEKYLLETDGYSSYEWFPEPDEQGKWEIFARVIDGEGNIHSTEPIAVNITGTPQLLLENVNPNQVLTGEVKLEAITNVPLDTIEYRITDPQTGEQRVVAELSSEDATYSWEPGQNDAGAREIQAVGTMPSGKQVTSDAVPVDIYLGTIYEPQPIMEKDRFLDFASELARDSQKKTGMSAALQTAQAILETGWGQSISVDKYTGKMSYNLFGIKGEGPAGTVTHNTWEEYNGNVVRVDDQFRAYNNILESWEDHKELLLTSSRYEPFTEVMHDSTLGAWALRRAGYATDSLYPLKLIDIVDQYDLYSLDEVNI